MHGATAATVGATADFVQGQQQVAEQMMEQARMWSSVPAAQQTLATATHATAHAHHDVAATGLDPGAMPADDDFLAQARYWSAQANAHAATTAPVQLP